MGNPDRAKITELQVILNVVFVLHFLNSSIKWYFINNNRSPAALENVHFSNLGAIYLI